MRSLIASLVAVLLVSPAMAETPRVLITPSGYFLLEIDSVGAPKVRQLAVLDLRVDGDRQSRGAGPDPALSDQVQKWARDEVDLKGAGMMAMIYDQVWKAVSAGHVAPLSASDVIADASNKLLISKWSTFRTRIGDEAADRLRRGDLIDVKSMSDFLQAIALGLGREAEEVTFPNAVEISATINQSIDAFK